MRNVFLALLSANLLFLAWALWIDTPPEANAQDTLSHLPRLQLVSEAPPGQRPASYNSNLPAAGLAAANWPQANVEEVALRADEPRAPRGCTSVGPFTELAGAARAAGLLAEQGFQPQQRAREGDTIEGYWVFVGGLQSDEEVSRVMDRLDGSGFKDAHVMRNNSTNRRISVGMFSTRGRAEKRAAAVSSLGLQPEVGERKFPGTVYYVDVLLEQGPQLQHFPPQDAFAAIGGGKVTVQPCPRPERPQTARTTIASAPPGPR